MSIILMIVRNIKTANETLMYVFKNQMMLGKHYLMLTIKHRDGYREYIKGDIDTVFTSDIITGVEYGDIVTLEHTDAKTLSDYMYLMGSIESLDILLDATKGIERCASFMMPKGSLAAYFVIKDLPMAHYTIDYNEIISEKMIGYKANILNNVCGKIDFARGIYHTLSTF